MIGRTPEAAPDPALPHLQRAELHAAQGRMEDALAEIERALADQPGDPRLLQMRGWLLLQLSRYREAAEQLREVLGAHPGMHHTGAMLAEALRLQGDIAGAERAILTCLEAAPDVAEYHLNHAAVLADSSGSGRAGRRAKKLALQRIGTALGLGHDDPDALRWAAQLVWQLGDAERAKELAETGLAIAPEHLRLRTLHADLTTATVVPTSRYDSVTRPMTQVAEAGKILAQAPQHQGARRALFTALWAQRMLRFDAPLTLIAILAVTAGASFSGYGSPVVLYTGAGIALLIGVLRLVGSALVGAQADRGFRRRLTGHAPLDVLRRVLGCFAWLSAGAGIVILPFVRDAVIVRWIIVWLGVAAISCFAASLIWQLGFPRASRELGGYGDDADTLHRLREHRGRLATRATLRVFGGALLLLLGLMSLGGREDAVPLVWLCTGALLATPIAGLLATRRTEGAVRRSLPSGVEDPQGYRPPRAAGLVVASLVGLGSVAALALGAAALPVLPNEHDADGVYVLEQPERGDGEERCSGRPAARIACQLDRMRERAESVTPPKVPELPEMPELPDLGQLGG